jgi:hypothetical protein
MDDRAKKIGRKKQKPVFPHFLLSSVSRLQRVSLPPSPRTAFYIIIQKGSDTQRREQEEEELSAALGPTIDDSAFSHNNNTHTTTINCCRC